SAASGPALATLMVYVMLPPGVTVWGEPATLKPSAAEVLAAWIPVARPEVDVPFLVAKAVMNSPAGTPPTGLNESATFPLWSATRLSWNPISSLACPFEAPPVFGVAKYSTRYVAPGVPTMWPVMLVAVAPVRMGAAVFDPTTAGPSLPK